jgi:hypothetical protein
MQTKDDMYYVSDSDATMALVTGIPVKSQPLWKQSLTKITLASAGVMFGFLGFFASSLVFTKKSGMFLGIMFSSVLSLGYQIKTTRWNNVLDSILPDEIKIVLFEATIVDLAKRVYKVAFVDSAEPFERFVKEMGPLVLATTDDERQAAFSNLGSKWRKRLLTPGLARALLSPEMQQVVLPSHVPVLVHDIHDEPPKLDKQVELAKTLIERRANEALGKWAKTTLMLARAGNVANRAMVRLIHSSWEEIHVAFFMSVLLLFFIRMIWRLVWHILGEYVFTWFV